MARPTPPMSASPRGRATALLVTTGAVIIVFATIALVDPTLGGQRRGFSAGLGAVTFAVVLVGLWVRTRVLPPRSKANARPGSSALSMNARILLIIAAVLWLMAGLFWYFALAGIDLRYGMDPVLLAVPLSIYPVLVFAARNLLRTSLTKAQR